MNSLLGSLRILGNFVVIILDNILIDDLHNCCDFELNDRCIYIFDVSRQFIYLESLSGAYIFFIFLGNCPIYRYEVLPAQFDLSILICYNIKIG